VKGIRPRVKVEGGRLRVRGERYKAEGRQLRAKVKGRGGRLRVRWGKKSVGM